jgi:hypothetical protein
MVCTYNRIDESLSWPSLIVQAAVWGLCSGATFYVLWQHPPQPMTTSPTGTTTLAKSKKYIAPTDWISMVCALLQPRLFMGFVLWQTFRQTNEENTSTSRKKDHDLRRTVMESPTVSTPTEAKFKDTSQTKKKKRYLELLVHNVSHTDLILGLEPVTPATNAPRPSSSKDSYKESSFILCRPRFSKFHKYSNKILQNLSPSSLLLLPCYQRRYDTPQYSIVLKKTSQGDTDYHQLPPTPTGLYLDRPVSMENGEVRVRGRDQEKMLAKMQIRHVFFPLIASLLPRWKQQIALKHHRNHQYGSMAANSSEKNSSSNSNKNSKVHRVLVLVSGVGTPRDTSQDPRENSTQVCAEIIKHFIQVVDPGITVLQIHSDWNIFRYDENVRFVKEVFMPRIHAYRDAHAKGLPYPHEEPAKAELLQLQDEAPFQEDWRNSFTTTLSWADGSNARTYAIQCKL